MNPNASSFSFSPGASSFTPKKVATAASDAVVTPEPDQLVDESVTATEPVVVENNSEPKVVEKKVEKVEEVEEAKKPAVEEKKEKKVVVSVEKPKAPKKPKVIVKKARPPAKTHINIVFIGHVDAGKSTIAGAILLSSGQINKRKMEKLRADAIAAGRESWWKAFVTDTNEEERAKGKTVEVGRSHFETETKRYTILDAPGHQAFVPNMIAGCAQADVAILVISARQGEFEAGFDRGGQTREHTTLARTLGVGALVVAVNKMDEKSVLWNEKRYKEIKSKLTKFLKSSGFAKSTHWIPISGLADINLGSNEGSPDWYSGPPLYDLLDQVSSQVTPPDVNQLFRLPVNDRFKDGGKLVIMGKIEGGQCEIGSKLILTPSGKECSITSIESEFGESKNGFAGDNVSIMLKGITETDINPGYVLSLKGQRICPEATLFIAQLVLLDMPAARPLFTAGFLAILHLGQIQTEVVCEKVVCEIDRKTGKKINKRITFAKKGQVVAVKLRVTNSIACETYTDYNQLARFTLRQEKHTVAVGKILKIF